MIRLGGVFFLWLSLGAAQVVPGQYIVELKAAPAAAARAGKGRQAGIDARAAVMAGQEELRADIRRRGGRVRGAVATVANAVIAELPEAEAAAIAARADVEAVYPVRTYRMHLDRALVLHGVPQAWALAGGRAGDGVKIGIIDTGIDITHPGFSDPSLTVAEGFPKVDAEAARAFTNNKVIVARSYGENETPEDGHGHGTGVAMAAAGVFHESPLGPISGIAPKAWLGSYKVLNDEGTTSDANVLLALDDAVADGMDVVNLSLGESVAPRPEDDPVARAIERASVAGVVVVVSAGNEGSDPNTIGSPGVATSAITVGAIRTAAGTVAVEGLPELSATLAESPGTRDTIAAPMTDAATLDPTGLACEPLPAGSLAGRIVLILRGECSFEDKLNNAEAAGAAAAVIYTQPETAIPFRWLLGSARLPMMMISNAAGLLIHQRLGGADAVPARLVFPGTVLAGFSSRGPNSDTGIKPDLVALGSSVLTADRRRGYQAVNGTSLSAPLVSGAAAVVRAARPGLTNAQYRSLVINSATPFTTGENPRSRVQLTGAGLLDVAGAVRNTVAAFPTSIGLGSGEASIDLYRDIELTNVGAQNEAYELSFATLNGPVPSVDRYTVVLAPGERQKVTMELFATDLTTGEYQGHLEIRGAASGTLARVPYWYAVPSSTPVFLTLLHAPGSEPVGETARFFFRVTDAVGLALRDLQPAVTALSGGGEVLEVRQIDATIPGAHEVRVRLGIEAGPNVFEVRVGNLPPRIVRITGTPPV